MLNRRHLRIKALHALYMCAQTNSDELRKIENDIFKSCEKMQDLYLLILSIYIELLHQARLQIERNKQKRLPSQEDLNPNLKFTENKFLLQLEENKLFRTYCETKKLNWSNDQELIRKLFKNLQESVIYQQYMISDENSYDTDRAFILTILEEIIALNEPLQYLVEEKNIFWYEDIDFIYNKLSVNIEHLRPDSPENYLIPNSVFKDEDDKDFIRQLIRKTILEEKEYEEIIKKKADNWEYDRIALIDRILLKMGICELLHFPSIPVKVTLNEYVDLARDYSTDKSNQFVNGILDKIVADFKASNRLNKAGRGLLE